MAVCSRLNDAGNGREGRGILGERLRSLRLAPRASIGSTCRGDRVLSEFLDHERRTRFAGEYLTKLDGATMYHGIEARSPFLDHSLWEFGASLPFGVRLHRGRPKAILRELARRRIGPQVAGRRKQGFGIPVQRWMAGRWWPCVAATLGESSLAGEGWIDPRAMRARLEQGRARGQVPLLLWYVFVLEAYLRHARDHDRRHAGQPP